MDQVDGQRAVGLAVGHEGLGLAVVQAPRRGEGDLLDGLHRPGGLQHGLHRRQFVGAEVQ